MTHPVTGEPDEVVAIVRRIVLYDDAIRATQQALDELARDVLAVAHGHRIPGTLLSLVRFTVDRLDYLHATRDWWEARLREVADVAETVPVRVGSTFSPSPNPEGNDPA